MLKTLDAETIDKAVPSVGGWNIPDVLEAVADEVPESPAITYGSRRISWRQFDTRARRVAVHLTEAGLIRGDSVVQYLRNCPEYLESFIAAMKASMVPVNTNYRYGPAELTYLWQDCVAKAVVFAGSFASIIGQMRSTVPGVLTWLWVDDGHGDCPSWATPYESVAGAETNVEGRTWERSGDDIVMLYTGGTTGMPKGVMWRQDDLFVLLGNAASGRYPDDPDLVFARSRVVQNGRQHLPAAPLMHGAGCLTCLPVMARGGGVVLLEGKSFDPIQLLDAIEQENVFSVGWVGDAFAQPVLAALDADPDRWDLRSWSVITSGGVLFSETVKQGLLRHLPGVMIADVYGSTEAIAAARSVTTAEKSGPVRSFAVGASVTVLDENDRPVVPGSGETGRVAYTGRLPLGYFHDAAKSASTFRMIDGVRHSFTGDFASVDDDGRIVLLGRGSSCINTGGEKVYPEEVEEILKRHPSVDDIVVLGVPDERFGERVAAAVKLADGFDLDESALNSLLRQHLAPYKSPRLFVVVDDIARGPNGKADVSAIRPLVLAHSA